jgi:hypothetical protein
MKTSTRFKIVGVEVVGMGFFLLVILALQLRKSHFNLMAESFGWDYGIIGLTLILVGLEILSLVKSLPGEGSSSSKIGSSAQLERIESKE